MGHCPLGSPRHCPALMQGCTGRDAQTHEAQHPSSRVQLQGRFNVSERATQWLWGAGGCPAAGSAVSLPLPPPTRAQPAQGSGARAGAPHPEHAGKSEDPAVGGDPLLSPSLGGGFCGFPTEMPLGEGAARCAAGARMPGGGETRTRPTGARAARRRQPDDTDNPDILRVAPLRLAQES